MADTGEKATPVAVCLVLRDWIRGTRGVLYEFAGLSYLRLLISLRRGVSVFSLAPLSGCVTVGKNGFFH